MTSIGNGAFEETPWYENKPDGLIYCGKVAYKYKGNMSPNSRIIIEEGMVSISSLAFSYCSNLTSVTIPNSVTSIGNGAFGDCLNLTSIVIPNSVTSIGADAFNGCSNLTSIDIPNSVTSIGKFAFAGTPWYKKKSDGLIYCGKVVYGYKGKMPSNFRIIIEEGTVSIGDIVFNDCSNRSNLTSVTIPNSVTSIGEGAFAYCSNLTSIVIPNSVTSIEREAFSGCGLTSIVIPNSVTSIEDYAFSNCSNLTSVTISNSVTSIGQSAFYGCSNLTSIVIPNSVTSIENYAFARCEKLQAVKIPKFLKFHSSCFEHCSPNLVITKY